MTVEIDISDIPYYAYYRDERSKRVEAILRDHNEYAGHEAKRYRTEGDPSLDPYFILDRNENYFLRMYTAEIDALDDSELLSYLIVVFEDIQKENLAEMIYVAGAGALAVFISLTITFQIAMPGIQERLGPGYALLMLLSLCFAMLFGVLGYRESRAYARRRKQHVAMTVNKHPLFFQAMRKLMSLTDISESERKNHLKRIQKIESIVHEEVR